MITWKQIVSWVKKNLAWAFGTLVNRSAVDRWTNVIKKNSDLIWIQLAKKKYKKETWFEMTPSKLKNDLDWIIIPSKTKKYLDDRNTLQKKTRVKYWV